MARGKTVRSSRNPVFKDTITLHAPSFGDLGRLSLAVYCQEAAGQADTLVGAAEVDLDAVIEQESKSIEDGAHKWMNLEGGVSGAVHVNIKVVIVPAK
mmetsp:Transcript_23091/g.46403  ORF Transcript_23091/g.46403 Transcript_23091/m.46403 type:complete len:98 (+) Transcript_23091:3-296(+)